MILKLIFAFTLIMFVVFAAACGGSEEADHQEDEHVDDPEDEHMDDHEDEQMDDMEHMHVDPPDEFADLSSPLHVDAEVLEAGEEIYRLNCETCHGPEGKGDGPAAVALDPAPANLADSMMASDMSDGYLFWRVSKGGVMEPFNSAMPAWEQALTDEQRWEVISYVRSLAGEGEPMDDNEDSDEHDADDDHDG